MSGKRSKVESIYRNLSRDNPEPETNEVERKESSNNIRNSFIHTKLNNIISKRHDMDTDILP